MTPPQHRALERLVEADADGLPLADVNDDRHIHHSTATALQRRGLAVIIRNRDRSGDVLGRFAKATTAGRTLALNSRPIEETVR